MSSTARNTVTVRTVRDIVDAVQTAAADGTTLTVSRAVVGTALQLDLSAMNAVVDYPARDMTITVEAGVTVHALTDLLKTEGQQLPVDVADPSMTVGAFVAADLAGPRQYGYGTLRDYLIGMEAVDGRGRVFHAGGRVVKNVAGYDLCRLIVGSRGLLGILSQVTFKLKPAPEQFLIQQWQFANQTEVTESLDILNDSTARPVVIDLQTMGNSIWSLFVGVEGQANVCDWQIEQLNREMSGPVSSDLCAANTEAAMVYCQEVASRHVAPDKVAVVRTLSSRVTDVCRVIHKYGFQAVCHAGNGVIIVCSGDSTSLPDQAVQQIQTLLKDHGGHIRVAKEDAVSRRSANSFAAGLVVAFDPNHVFV